MLGYNEGITPVLSGGEVLLVIIGNVDGITLAINVGTDLVSLDTFFIVLLVASLRCYFW